MAQSNPKVYPIADLGRVPDSLRLRAGSQWMRNVAAVLTGEFRPPKVGEWYISGAIAEAYSVSNDLTSAYAIAELVLVERRQVVEIVGYASES